MRCNPFLYALILLGLFACKKETMQSSFHSSWYRPAKNPLFNTTNGNNHDPILFVDTSQTYPYHLIISGWQCHAANQYAEQTYLWRAKSFSWSSADWELVDDHYQIGCQYEYDDAVKVDSTYYIYENGVVYTYAGNLSEGSGKWAAKGAFPRNLCDDIGVIYANGFFHLFGEYGRFEDRPDGKYISHLRSKTGLGQWEVVDLQQGDPNSQYTNPVGVGDPCVLQIGAKYVLYCDVESTTFPYQIDSWTSTYLSSPFTYEQVAVKPRTHDASLWDNYRVQDADVEFIPELNQYVMVCNFLDVDQNPAPTNFPRLNGRKRVIGVLYSPTGLP
jgi:hypothetical protein